MRSEADGEGRASPTQLRRVYLDTVEVWRSSRHGPTTPSSNLQRIDPKARAICVPIRRSSHSTFGVHRHQLVLARLRFRAVKPAQVVAMLRRKNGATLSEIMKTMGCQKHMVRGFMAGAMKKAGHAVESFKPEGGERTYRLCGAPHNR
jgi:hypothetical protein